MIAVAAIDLRGGRVVQLVGGEPGTEQVDLPDPRAAARRWVDAGFVALHVVDLDAALGAGDNRGAIRTILEECRDTPVQVGGGIRTTEAVQQILDEGAAAVIVGTRGVQDRRWLEAVVERWPGRVVVAADVRGTDIVVRGWTASSGIRVETLLDELAPLPLRAILVTDVSREGRMLGADVARFRSLAARSGHPLLASGGVAGPADLAALADAGVAGVVLGMALYTGALDPVTTAREYRT